MKTPKTIFEVVYSEHDFFVSLMKKHLYRLANENPKLSLNQIMNDLNSDNFKETARKNKAYSKLNLTFSSEANLLDDRNTIQVFYISNNHNKLFASFNVYWRKLKKYYFNISYVMES